MRSGATASGRFYIYDLYTALGMDREAKSVYRRFTRNTDDFPRRGNPLVPRLVLPAMAGLRAGRGHEQVLSWSWPGTSRATPAAPTRGG